MVYKFPKASSECLSLTFSSSHSLFSESARHILSVGTWAIAQALQHVEDSVPFHLVIKGVSSPTAAAIAWVMAEALAQHGLLPHNWAQILHLFLASYMLLSLTKYLSTQPLTDGSWIFESEF
jgi:hypothetical protein